MRTIDWDDGAIVLIDQTALPERLVTRRICVLDDLLDAIDRLAIRGAPALGAAGAFGVVLIAAEAQRARWDATTTAAAVARLRSARPTAKHLAVGVDRVHAHWDEGVEAMVHAAKAVLEEDASANRAIGSRGAAWLEARCAPDRRLVLATHCNAGALACVEWGTALGIVRTLATQSGIERVVVGETRPLLQGARLTAWELAEAGIPHEVVVDAAQPGLILGGGIDAVVVGADRIAANGDVANKVGTLGLALAAARAGVPFVVAAPEATIDPQTPTGDDIVIEERDVDEVHLHGGRRCTPASSPARNPAFDVTPADLVTAIVTEHRTIEPQAGHQP